MAPEITKASAELIQGSTVYACAACNHYTPVDADEERASLGDDCLSTEHLLLAMVERLDLDRDTVLDALKQVRGSQRVTSEKPEDTYQALEQ